MYLQYGGIKRNTYVKFLKHVSNTVRRYVTNSQDHVVFINDNATIHKGSAKKNPFIEENLDLLYTVAYSPQTNAAAENFFSFLKSKVDDIEKKHFLHLSDSKFLFAIKTAIKDILNTGVTKEMTVGWYAHTISQWRRCTTGLPLTTFKIAVNMNDPLLDMEIFTIRRK